MSRKIIAIILAACLLAAMSKTLTQASAQAGQAADIAVEDEGAGNASGDQKSQDSPGDQKGQDVSGDQNSQETPGDNSKPAAVLAIDNGNIYDGMDRPFSQGYAPRIADQQALVVVPLVLEGETALKNNSLRVSLDLGDTVNSPFSYRNYDKNITLQSHKVNNGADTVESFVASFGLELLPERYNGSYPVTLKVEGTDVNENLISQNFVVYVTIADGKDPNAVSPEPEPEPEPVEPPTFAPKLLVQSYRYSKEEILAGDEVTVEITLQNTSTIQSIQNLTVTLSEPGEYLTLQSPSDSVYIGGVKAGETCTVSFTYRVNAAAPEGQYDLALSMDYADAKGNTYTGSGKAKLAVKQPVKLQFDPVVLPSQMEVGDVTQLQLSAMNLGRCKVYHVRAEVKADGLTPQGTVFIGDIEAGAMAAGSTQISVGGLTEGSSMYGETKGTVTYYYEDEAGVEQSLQTEFTAAITSPFSPTTAEEEDEPGQWWVLMAVALVLLLACAAFLAVRSIQEKKRSAKAS